MRKTDAAEQSSKDLEALYPRILFDIQDYAIYLLDQNGNILTWNKGCIQLQQFLPEEIIGKNFKMLYPDNLKEKNSRKRNLRKRKRTVVANQKTGGGKKTDLFSGRIMY